MGRRDLERQALDLISELQATSQFIEQYMEGLDVLGLSDVELGRLERDDHRQFVECLAFVGDYFRRTGRRDIAPLWKAWALKEAKRGRHRDLVRMLEGNRAVAGLGH